MPDAVTVINVPNAGAGADAYTRFAYALGDLLTSASAEVARLQAAAIEDALRSDLDQMTGSYLRALRALVTGWADATAKVPAREEHRRERGTAKRQLLEYLVRTQRAVRPKDLDDVLTIRPESRSRLLAQLTADGLVERLEATAAVDDGRAVRYRATPDGTNLVTQGHRLGLPAAEVSDAEVAHAKAAVARSLLAKAQEARRDAIPLAASGDAEPDPASLPGAATLDRVLAVAADVDDDMLVVDALGERATCLRQAGLKKRAAIVLDSSAFQGVVSSGRVAADYARGREAYERGRLAMLSPRTRPQSLGLLLDADRLLTPWTDAPVRVWNAVAVSECHRQTGNVLGALKYASLAQHLADRGEDDFARAKASLHLAFIHRVLGQATAAASAIDRAETLASSRGYASMLVECNYHRGETLRYRGKVGEAKSLLRSAADAMGVDKTPRRGWAFALSALGACFFDDGDVVLAETLLSQALSVAKTCRSADAEALTMRRLGVLYTRQEQFDAATNHLNGALRLYSRGMAENLIGQLECRTALSFNASSRKQSLRGAEKSLEKLAQIDLAPAEVWKDSTRMTLVDRWVYNALVETATQQEEPVVTATEVKHLWGELYSDGIAAYPNVQHGLSLMGKEPALVVN